MIRKLTIVAGASVILILLWNPLSRLVFSVRLALTLQEMAKGVEEKHPDVIVEKISRRVEGQEYFALVYRPIKKIPSKGLILAPGISEKGCYHPKLVALSRYFAEQGLLVVTPDIEEFRQLQLSVAPVRQMIIWFKEVEKLDGRPEALKIGMAGVSFTGTLALMAAADPGIRDRVAFAVSIGPYYNLPACVEQWLSPDPDDSASASSRLYARSKYYARWILMLSALGMVPEQDRAFLNRTLMSLLLEKGILTPMQKLTSEGERLYRYAIAKNPSDQEFVRALQEHLKKRWRNQLDPDAALQQLRCPVFLIHGAYDDLIPPGESMEIHRRVPNSYLLISPFLTHTAPSAAKLSLRQKAAAAFDALAFSYRFAGAIR